MRQQLTEDYLSHKKWFRHGDKIPWRDHEAYAGKITTQAEAADYAADARDNASVEALAAAKKVIIYMPNGAVGVELSFRSDGAENVDSVIQLFASAGVDHYRHIDVLTLVQGTQVFSDGIYFVDTITSAGETWLTATAEPSPTDSIASYSLNMHGYDRLWIVSNDLDTTSLYVDFKQL